MKKNIFILLVIFLTASSMHALAQKETRQVSGFDEVSMGIAGDLYLTQGNTILLELEGDSDDLEDVITEVKNGALLIRYKNSRGWSFSRARVTVNLTMPEITSVSLGGSGKIHGKNTIEADDLYLSVSGSGKINLEVEADDLTQKISGSGSMVLTGSADRADLSISGSGSLDGLDLEVDDYTVKISGSGKCKISVGDALEANISGSGSVYYKGDPDRIRSNVSGSGKVKPY